MNQEIINHIKTLSASELNGLIMRVRMEQACRRCSRLDNDIYRLLYLFCTGNQDTLYHMRTYWRFVFEGGMDPDIKVEYEPINVLAQLMHQHDKEYVHLMQRFFAAMAASRGNAAPNAFDLLYAFHTGDPQLLSKCRQFWIRDFPDEAELEGTLAAPLRLLHGLKRRYHDAPMDDLFVERMQAYFAALFETFLK